MAKLERAKRFLQQAVRPGLKVLSLALLAAGAYAQGTVFNVTGTFDDGGDTLGGTITIDTTGSGGILSEDLTVDPTVIMYTFTGENEGSGVESIPGSGAPYFDDALFFGNSSSELVLNIYLGDANSFVGYAGGNLCSEDQSCGEGNETAFSFVEQGPSDPPLVAGTLTAATPEPSTALLAIGGGAAILTLRRRKRRA
jgi:PEP-CTERM motif